MPAQKLVARYAGAIVGTRKSPRPYTHAVVAQAVEAVARAYAYEYAATPTDRSNFDYATMRAAYEPGVPQTIHVTHSARPWSYEVTLTAEQIAEERARIEGGFEGYVARLREKAIAGFEQTKAEGGFEPFVFGWSMSAANAQKMASGADRAGRRVLAIVEAERA